MTKQNPDDAENIIEEIDEAFEVDPLSPRGNDSGLDNEKEDDDDDEKETDGNVPVANLE